MWIISKNEISFNLKQLTKSINSIFVFFLRFFGKFVFLLKIFPIFLIFSNLPLSWKKSVSLLLCVLRISCRWCEVETIEQIRWS